MRTVDQWRQAAWPIWEAIFSHPYIRGLADGSLPQAAFRYFIGQDFVYLQDFARVLTMAAARSPDREARATLLRHVEVAHQVETDLHRRVAPDVGLDPTTLGGTAPGPVTRAYLDHLVRSAWERPFVAVMAAVLPCYWIYEEVGRRLALSRPDFPPYREWIATYAGEAYGASVAEALDIAERSAHEAGGEALAVARQAFWVSSRYEWLFWEQAWSEGRALRAAVLPPEPVE
jgi:thiaminase/transcriptional activator TenA